jgi:hypothetical protein
VWHGLSICVAVYQEFVWFELFMFAVVIVSLSLAVASTRRYMNHDSLDVSVHFGQRMCLFVFFVEVRLLSSSASQRRGAWVHAHVNVQHCVSVGLQLFLKVFAYGPHRFWKNGVRRLDLLVTMLGVVNLLLFGARGHKESALWFHISAAAQGFRLVKLIYANRAGITIAKVCALNGGVSRD